MFATGENDFSAMNNDLLSDLIKQSALKDTWSSNELLDKKRFLENANPLFMEKDYRFLIHTFTEGGDHCEPVSPMTNAMKCSAKRWWNVNNVGYPYMGIVKNIDKYIYPGVQINFEFFFNEKK